MPATVRKGKRSARAAVEPFTAVPDGADAKVAPLPARGRAASGERPDRVEPLAEPSVPAAEVRRRVHAA
jgi:hypothetical protein